MRGEAVLQIYLTVGFSLYFLFSVIYNFFFKEPGMLCTKRKAIGTVEACRTLHPVLSSQGRLLGGEKARVFM